VELGVKFRVEVNGRVTAVRFYKTPRNTGPHSVSLWNRSGICLATAPAGKETDSGWQQVALPTPVAVQAKTTYLASYRCESGFYAHNKNYFEKRGPSSGPLHLLADGSDEPNGVFKYKGTSRFPDEGFAASNYWVDVVFTPQP
jgi:hypothetical protein